MRAQVQCRFVPGRLALAASIVALGLAGCGGSDNGGGGGAGSSSSSNDAGAKVFSDAGCKTCHTLKAAGATGSVGPDLDKLQPSTDLVNNQVNSGGGAMPSFKGKLSDAQIKAVADYVSANAGKG
jgi:mono/diheme cytochrome c family protein